MHYAQIRHDDGGARNRVGEVEIGDRLAEALSVRLAAFRRERLDGTAIGRQGLVEQGKMALSDPVAKYLPEFKDVKVGVEKRDANGTVTLELVAADRPMTIQDLMRHTIPSGDPAAIIDRALTVLLAQLERSKLAATSASSGIVLRSAKRVVCPWRMVRAMRPKRIRLRHSPKNRPRTSRASPRYIAAASCTSCERQ